MSNISFSFRGNDPIREAIHTAFLYHAVQAGMTMGIVNAGQLGVYADIPAELLERVEDVLFDRRPDATERLVAFAETYKKEASETSKIWPGAAAACRSVSPTRWSEVSTPTSSKTPRRPGPGRSGRSR